MRRTDSGVAEASEALRRSTELPRYSTLHTRRRIHGKAPRGAHGSFFSSKRANTWFGRVCALVVMQPFADWRHDHAVHHGTAGDLDRRGTGDIPTLTVAEYHQRDRLRSPRLSALSQPAGHVRDRANLDDDDRAATEHECQADATATQRRPDQRRTRRGGRGTGPGVRLGGLGGGGDGPSVLGRRGGRLAVLRTAPVRGCLLGAQAASGATPTRRCKAAHI